MGSWVYIFSKFTPEALLFETLIICLLSGGYAAFWILKKRRLGVAGKDIPSGVIKGYLNELILDAERLRAQLFGLLQSAGVPIDTTTTLAAQPAAVAAVAADPALVLKITQLEAQMQQQLTSMQNLTKEKERVEKELAAAKTTSKTLTASAGDSAAIADLKTKISSLEGKLAEYSVIEDDLANLKRLQQENAQLKAALGGSAAAVVAAAAPTPTPAAEAAAPTPAAEPAAMDIAAALAPAVPETPAAEPTVMDIAAALAPAAPETPAPAAAAPEAALPENAFEGLVNQVEESLQPSAPANAPAEAAAPAAPAADPAPAPAAAANTGSSDADLVAEFEKMLNA